jgi:hypothetical protein
MTNLPAQLMTASTLLFSKYDTIATHWTLGYSFLDTSTQLADPPAIKVIDVFGPETKSELFFNLMYPLFLTRVPTSSNINVARVPLANLSAVL